jgi:hypothetical protein
MIPMFPHWPFLPGGNPPPPDHPRGGSGPVWVRWLLVSAVLLTLFPVESPAWARGSDTVILQGSPSSPALFAEQSGWSIWTLLGTLNHRSRIIPFCVVVMAIALFIMIKKFDAREDQP